MTVNNVLIIEITTYPQDRLLPFGSSVSLTCTSSVSSDVKFSWTHDGKDVTRRSASTGDTSVLTISIVRRRNGGSYVCTVWSGSLSVMSNAATVTVLGVLFVCSCDNYVAGVYSDMYGTLHGMPTIKTHGSVLCGQESQHTTLRI